VAKDEVLATLLSLGFEETDAKVYIYLAKKGLRKASDICKSLNLKKQQFYPSIKNLQSNGIVSSTIEHPARFSAMPFEKVLDLLIKAKIEETQRLQQSKENILLNWKNLELDEDKSSKFGVISGRTFIFLRIQQMVQEAREYVLAITAIPTLLQASQHGIFDFTLTRPLEFRFLSEFSQKTLKGTKAFLKEAKEAKIKMLGRSPDVSLSSFPQMIVRDNEEALFFIHPRTESSIIEKDDVCLWTDCKTLVKGFLAVFEELWRNSTNIQQKILALETKKRNPKTFVIEDSSKAQKKYEETLRQTKKDIIIMTSAEGLNTILRTDTAIIEKAKEGVSIKIMAPIVTQNYNSAEHLLKFCEIRHVPINYAETMIIDGTRLLKFKPFKSKDERNSEPNFEELLYSEDNEYVKKMERTLCSIWNNALIPSIKKLDSMFGPFGSLLGANEMLTIEKTSGVQIAEVKPVGTVTEQEVLNEILNAKRLPANDPIKEPMREYASLATAVIHPPKEFNLPEMMIMVHKIEKQSTFGATDALVIHMLLETPSGPTYVPVAVATDSPKAQQVWKLFYSKAPAGSNVRLLKKDEIQVRVHGNTLFAGWTVPIPLMPLTKILPPACLIVEGYGDIRTTAFTLVFEPGFRANMKCNFFNAFVTFMHPSSKYSGPGIDGVFTRDFIMTCYPPQNLPSRK
jgi:sugar-specific transcriptional regulator TrmB